MHDSTHIAYRVIDAFFRHRWLMLVSMVTVVGVAALGIFTRPKTYTATAYTRVLTDDTASLVGVGTSPSGWKSLAQQNVDRFEDLLTDAGPGGFLDKALKSAELSHPISVG